MKITFALLLAANSALAFPMVKRQNPVSSVLSSVVESATSAIQSATSAASTALATSQASAIPSAASSLVSSAAVSSSAPSAAPSLFPGALAFPCADGTQLIYVERQTNVDAALSDVQVAVANFTDSALFNPTNATGGNEPGATRTIMVADAMANEVLTNYTINGETGAIYQTWNATAPVTVSTITVSSYTTEFQTYINDTETSATAPVSTIKIFSNICASDPAAGEAFFATFFESALQNGTVAAQGGASPSANPSSAVSSAIQSASSVVSSAISSAIAPVASSASSAVAVATSAVSGASSAIASVQQTSGFLPQPTGAPGGALLVNTPPSLVQCQPAAITFNGGSGPYFLSVLPGGQAGAAPLVQFGEQASAGAYTWVVNIPAGTQVTLAVRDGTGSINYSSPVTILAGPDSSCLPTA